MRPVNPIAIVGAGIGGIAAARTLRQRGLAIEILDKGRSIGGRIATRRDGRFQFDHGAQFFTVRDERFQSAVAPLRTRGLVQVWTGPFRTLVGGQFGADPRPGTVREVAVPRMTMLPRELARLLEVDLAGAVHVQCSVRVRSMQRRADGWWLEATTSDGVSLQRGPFAGVLLALPPAQAHELLAASGVEGPVADAARLARDRLSPCLCAMVVFADEVPEAKGGMFVTDEVLGFAAHDGGKPGRSASPSFVLHATPTWSRQNLERDPQTLARELVLAFERALGAALPETVHCKGHRWRYAIAAGEALPGAAVVDPEGGLAFASDALVGGRVEGGFCSGVAAATALALTVQ